MNKNDFPSDKEYEQTLKEREKALEKVKDVLDNLDELFATDKLFKEQLLYHISLQDILKAANVKEDLYYKSLSTAKTGKVIVLKRDVCEIWVNNYNWNWYAEGVN